MGDRGCRTTSIVLQASWVTLLCVPVVGDDVCKTQGGKGEEPWGTCVDCFSQVLMRQNAKAPGRGVVGEEEEKEKRGRVLQLRIVTDRLLTEFTKKSQNKKKTFLDGR